MLRLLIKALVPPNEQEKILSAMLPKTYDEQLALIQQQGNSHNERLIKIT